jgi:hypothetical protein
MKNSFCLYCNQLKEDDKTSDDLCKECDEKLLISNRLLVSKEILEDAVTSWWDLGRVLQERLIEIMECAGD